MFIYAGLKNSQNVVISSLASLVVVLLFASTLLFIIGCFCGRIRLYRKQKKAANEMYAEARTEETTYSQMYPQNVLYEDVVIRRQEQDLELKQNEAYGPIRPH